MAALDLTFFNLQYTNSTGLALDELFFFSKEALFSAEDEGKLCKPIMNV
jgi:hypothetical protein